MLTLLTYALLLFIVGTVVLALLDFAAAVLAERQSGTAADQRFPAASGVVFAVQAAPVRRRARRR